MKRLFHTIMILLFVLAAFLALPNSALASEGDDGHGMEVDVDGYHVTIASQNEWVKGENVVVVTITDAMGMPVSNAEVELLIAPKADEHTASASDSHGAPETDDHAEPPADEHGSVSSHDSMSDTDEHEDEDTAEMAHDEEASTPLVMTESHEHGKYTVEAHLERSGEHVVQVFFHVNGEMLQADFLVDIPGMASKTVVLWSFLFVNIGLIISAGVLKNQTVTVKGK